MIEKILTPFQKFDKIQSLGGILLFLATIVALIWANTPLSEYYDAIKNYKLGVKTEDINLVKPLVLWVNDGLMAIFFFLIGLEIKRELLIGELNSPKKITFPLIAAIGGMLVPVALFFMLNKNPETIDAWGIPMATDIAFSLAILKLLGNRVPLSLKVFLTAFAIVDDIGAVLVIALFYSGGIKWGLIIISAIMLAVLYYFSYKEKYYKYLILLFAAVIWVLFLKAGIHPTIAGVLVAFSIPIRQKIDVKTYTSRLCEMADDIKLSGDTSELLSKTQIEKIDDLEDWTNKVQSPLQHLEHRLQNWVAYLIMPVFALFNAGVSFSFDMNIDTALMINISLSLILGKTIGISLLSYLGIKLKLSTLPGDMRFIQVVGVALLAGVGFTMSIFISNLAFAADSIYIDSAKLGILAGSMLSGILGYLLLRFTFKSTK